MIRERACGLLSVFAKEVLALPEGSVFGVAEHRALDARRLLPWLDDRCRNGVGETAAKCYRRWLASYLEDIGNTTGVHVRNWTPPHTKEAALQADAEDAERLSRRLEDGASISTPSATKARKGDRAQDQQDQREASLAKSLNASAFKLISDELLCLKLTSKEPEFRYQHGPKALMFFTATLMTGLRPMEWAQTRYLDTFTDPETLLTLGPVLEVRTLKQANRREDNPLRNVRYLVLDEWPQDQLDTVKSFVSFVESCAGEFSGEYDKIRMTLQRAWKRLEARLLELLKDDSASDLSATDKKKLAALMAGLAGASTSTNISASNSNGKRKPSLSIYTARHIFAEEVRRSGSYTRFELAALLGHSMLTNQTYYGRRAWDEGREFRFVLPKPWPGDAEDIMKWDAKVNPLRGQYMSQQELFSELDAEAIAQREHREGVDSFFRR